MALDNDDTMKTTTTTTTTDSSIIIDSITNDDSNNRNFKKEDETKDDKEEEIVVLPNTIQSYLLQRIIKPIWFSLSIGTVSLIVSSISNQALIKCITSLITTSTTGTAVSMSTSSSTSSSSPGTSSTSISSRSSSSSSSTTSRTSGILPLPSAIQLSIPISSFQTIITPTILYIVIGGTIASFIRTLTINYTEEYIVSILRYDIFQSFLLIKRSQTQTQTQTQTTNSSNTSDNQQQNDVIKTKSNDIEVVQKSGNRFKPTKKKGNKDDEELLESTITIPIIPAVGIQLLNDTTINVSKMISNSIPNMIRGILSVTISCSKMIVMDQYLFIISLSTVPIIGSLIIVLYKIKNKLLQQQQNLLLYNNEYVIEKLNHIDLVQLSYRQYDEIYTYQQQLQTIHNNIGIKIAIQSATIMGFIFFTTSCTLLIVLQQGISRQHYRSTITSTSTTGTGSNTSITPTNLTSFVTYTFLLGLGTSSITKSLSEISLGMKSLKRLYSIIQVLSNQQQLEQQQLEQQKQLKDDNEIIVIKDSQQQTQTQTQPIVDIDQIESIVMKNVSFSYYTTTDNDTTTTATATATDTDTDTNAKLILNNISISFPRGHVTAIVGKNGCGKSTCTKLLCGLYQPLSGTVHVQMQLNNSSTSSSSSSSTLPPTTYPINDFINTNSTTRRQKQKQQNLIQIIPQKIGLFNISIYDNVRYCQPDATRDEVVVALERANCTSFVHTLADGIDTIIGVNGNILSGGQQQRIALARILVIKQTSIPILLIMDEPNNNLDTDGYNAIIETIQYCRKSNIAVCIISHDIHTLQHTDTIVVLNTNGTIAEHGTFQQLSSNKSSTLCQIMPNILLL